MAAPGLHFLSSPEAFLLFIVGLPFALIGWYVWQRGGEAGKYGFFLLVVGGILCLPAIVVLATIASAIIGVLMGLAGIIFLIVMMFRG